MNEKHIAALFRETSVRGAWMDTRWVFKDAHLCQYMDIYLSKLTEMEALKGGRERER